EVLQETRAVACSTALAHLVAQAVEASGHPVVRMPSGAGHDAVNFGPITETGMLFVRCGNGGVSHSPRETITAQDADLAARALLDVLTAYQE
ncbi:MAG: M20/M25/M40 family metallo-hydrolase, partial [Xanthobacteraceae bacterium]